jgi:fused signal recognition particle receptor
LDDGMTTLYLVLGILVLAALVVVGLVTSGRRRGTPTPPVDTRTSPTLDVPPAEEAVPPAGPVTTVERPEGTASRLVRLRQRLAGSQGGFGRGLLALLSRDRLDEGTWEAIEDTLLTADVGVAPTQQLVENLRTRLRVDGAEAGDPRGVLRDELLQLVGPDLDRRLQVSGADGKPGVVLVVGVNGTGKTTTVGKLAYRLKAAGHSVLLAAADTFRAAAVEQLREWGTRAGVPVIAQTPGADPAAVVHDALLAARARNTDVVIADTAGRLHTASGLMDELEKIKRIMARFDATAPHEVLLVLDASQGQNALAQALKFHERLGVTGLVITKLDGTAKGGILLAIARQLRVPIRLVAVGEGIDDIDDFRAADFVRALIGERAA